MRLDAAFLNDAATVAVMRALGDAGHRALFAGGCVRDALLGLPVRDIDIATDARPDRVMDLARAAGLDPHPTGIAHGTVTVVSQGRPHEVTTFRRDVETFGRHATVAFTDDVATDAARRDLTMNALYAGADGTLVDPLGGLADLLARRVRFVGDPAARIAEDSLRILRFFRFHAWYGDAATGLDAAGLAACAAGAAGLDHLSRERVGNEMRKLLAAPDPSQAVTAMAAAGILPRILPGATADDLAALVAAERGLGLAPSWQRRLALVAPGARTAELKLSRAEAAALARIRGAACARIPPAHAGYRYGAEAARDAALIAAAQGAALTQSSLDEIARGAASVLPVRAADLLPRLGQTPALGQALKAIERRWIASGFTLDRTALLAGIGDEG
jgi:poly(A) polymerase